MKLAQFILPLALLAPISVQAAFDTGANCQGPNPAASLMTDVIIVRPLGLVGTIVGSALFVGLSPLTALANIAPPHNAFNKVGWVLVGMPYAYTFERPVGYFCQ